MKRTFSFALAFCVGAFPALAATRYLLLGVGGGGGGGAYAPPALSTPYAIAFGDSRARAAGGISTSGTSPTKTVTYSYANFKGWSAWLPTLSGNEFAFHDGYNYGVDTQDTAGFAGRMALANNYCNYYANVSSVCFTADQATISSATTTTLTTTANPTSGVTFSVSAGSPTVYASAAVGLQSVTLVSGSNGGTSFTTTAFLSTPSGAVAFVPAAYATNWTAYLGGGNGQAVDILSNFSSTGQYSPETDPAVVIFMNGGDNDKFLPNSAPNSRTLSNWDAILDAFGPLGANKIVIAGNEAPYGLAAGYSQGNATHLNGDPEVYTLTNAGATCGSSPYQVTGALCIQVVNHTACASQPCPYTGPNGSFFLEPNSTAQTWQAGGPLPVITVPCGSRTTGTAANTYSCPPGATANGTNAFSPGSNDGTVLTVDPVSGDCPSSGSGSTVIPSVGHFCVNAQGVFTFNSGLLNGQVGIYYRSIQFSDASPSVMKLINDYFNHSGCTGGTLTSLGANWTTNGAQCNRPWVHVADIWDADVDTNIPSNCGPTYCWNAPFTSLEGAHYTPYGASLTAQAMVNAATAAGAVPSTPVIQPPTNVSRFFTANGVFSASAQTYDATKCPSITGTSQKYFLTTLNPSITGLTQLQAQTLYPSGAYLSSSATNLFNLSTNPGTGTAVQIDCWDTTNNLVHLAPYGGSGFAGIAANTTAAKFMIHVDGNLLPNGVFCYPGGTNCPGVSPTATTPIMAYSQSGINIAACNQGGGSNNYLCPAPSTGKTATQGYPGYQTQFLLDSGSSTALNSYTFGLAMGFEQNPLGDGYDSFTMRAQGYAGSSAGSLLITIPLLALDAQNETSGDWHRAICQIAISAGPNGHLYGLQDVTVAVQDTSNAAFSAPGDDLGADANAYKNWIGSGGGGGSAWSDASLQTGAPGVQNIGGNNTVIFAQASTPSQMVAAGLGSTAQVNITFHWMASDPQSWTARIERCGVFKTTASGATLG